MLTIRLSRIGKKKHPLFRVIISEKSKDTVGDYLELLGTYNPHTNQAELKDERIKYWLSQGASTSGTVHNLLVDKKIIDAKKKKVANIRKKKEEKKEEQKNQPNEKEEDKKRAGENKSEPEKDKQKTS